MSLDTAELSPSYLMLSTGLVSALGGVHSTLRATTARSGSMVVIYAGGDVDACNEQTWRRLLSEAAAVVTAPGPLIVDVNDLAFMGCCAYQALAGEQDRCQRRGIDLRLVSHQPTVARIIAVCALSGVLAVHPSVDSALLAVSTGTADW